MKKCCPRYSKITARRKNSKKSILKPNEKNKMNDISLCSSVFNDILFKIFKMFEGKKKICNIMSYSAQKEISVTFKQI